MIIVSYEAFRDTCLLRTVWAQEEELFLGSDQPQGTSLQALSETGSLPRARPSQEWGLGPSAPQPAPRSQRPGSTVTGLELAPATAGAPPKVIGLFVQFHLLLPIDALSLFQGLNPGKAIAEIKKMMATYKEKQASAYCRV